MVKGIPLLSVRPAEIADARRIAQVHVATWRSAYRELLPQEFLASLSETHYEERWARTLSDATARVYVAESSEGVVGFASGGRERAGEDRYDGELYALYVQPRAQGLGFGRRLVSAVVESLREGGFSDMIVWVLRDNSGARGFYERLGGVYVRTQPITIGSAVLQEVSYGWRSLDTVRH